MTEVREDKSAATDQKMGIAHKPGNIGRCYDTAKPQPRAAQRRIGIADRVLIYR